MDLGWKSRVRFLLITLIFWKHSFGQSWTLQNVRPQHNEPVHKLLSPQGVQSSVLEATVSGSIPAEDVTSNILVRKRFNASRSRFSFSPQYVKGGLSSSYESMSQTQSGPSSSASASSVLPQQSLEGLTSLLQLQGSSSPSVQDVALQFASGPGSKSQYASSYGYGLQGVSAQLAPASVERGSSSGSSIQSPTSYSVSQPNLPSLNVYSQPTTDQLYGPQLGVASSQQSGSSTGYLASPLSSVGSTSRGSTGPQMAGGSSQLVSTLGAQTTCTRSPSTSNQNIPESSAYAKLAASPLDVSQSPSGQSSYSQYTSSSQSSVGSQLAASSPYGLQGASSRYAPSSGVNLPVSSLPYQATPSGPSPSQSAPKWQSSGTQGLQPSSTAVSQGFQMSGVSQVSSLSPSRFYSLSSAGGPSSSTSGSSLWPQGTSSQYAPAALDVEVPLYSQAASSGSPSWSLSQQSQRQPYRASGTMPSQSSSLSQGSNAPSRLSTLISAASPGQFASMQQGSGGYSGFSSQSPSGSSWSPSRHHPHHQFQRQPSASQGFQTSGTVAFPSSSASLAFKAPSRVSTTSASSPSQFVSMQGGSARYGLSSQSQSTSSLYNPTASSGSSWSLSQQSQWQPSASRWSQASGTVPSQSSSLSQGFGAPSRLSIPTSPVSPGLFASTLEGSGGLSGPSQSASSLYIPGSPAYAKRGSFLGVTGPSASDQSSFGLSASSSQSMADTLLSGSSSYVPVQTGSTFTDGSALQLQGTSSQYAPALLDAKVPASSQAASRGSLSLSQQSQWQPITSQGFQASGIGASQISSASQGSKAPSRLSIPPSPVSPSPFASALEGSGGLSGQSQSVSSQYISGSPAYAKCGSSLLGVNGQSASDVSSFGLSASSSQNMADPLLSGSSSYVPVQTGSTFTDGSALQLQGTSSQYAPALLTSEVPASSQAASRGSLSLSQQSQWQPSASRWSQAFGTVPSQSSSLSQGFGAPSRLSIPTSPVSPGLFASTLEGSGGLSGQSHSASSRHIPGSPVYAKHGSSFLGVASQSASDRSSFGLSASSSQSMADPLLSGSSSYVPVQTGSTFTDGSALQLQGTSSQYAPALLNSEVPASSQAASRGSLFPWQSSNSQGFQTPSTVASQISSASQAFKAPSRVSTASASSPSQFVSMQVGSGRYGGLSSQSPQAAPSGSSYLSQLSQKWNPSTSRQGFQASGTAVSQSSSQSSNESFLPALTPPVAQSSQSSISTSRRTSNLFGARLRPFKLPSQAPSGSLISSHMSPDLFASVQQPAESMTLSQGMFSGQSSGSTSISSGSGSRSSQSASASARYSSVKG